MIRHTRMTALEALAFVQDEFDCPGCAVVVALVMSGQPVPEDLPPCSE